MARSISRRSATPAASQYTPEPETDHDEQPERPGRRRPASTAPEATTKNQRDHGPSATGGWGGYSEQKAKGGKGFGETLKVGPEPKIIAFCQEEPFAVYREHWIQQEGRQSFTCHDEDCPLCEVDQKKPALRVLFNVITFDDGDPKVVILRAGVQLSDLIHDWATGEKTSPINREDLYWAVKRLEKKSGGRTKYEYAILPVKKRDLLEDYDVEPLSADERAELMDNLFEAEGTVRIDPVEDLEELAEGLAA